LSIALVLVVAIVGAGCGDAPDEVQVAASPDDAPVTSPSVASAPPGRPMTLQPRDGLDHVRPLVWERAELAADGRSVDVWFTGGIEACWGLARAEATSGPGTLTIALDGGEVPQDAACPELGVTYLTRIVLDAPAPAGVRLVDAAA
jgi:hypothetical protein